MKSTQITLFLVAVLIAVFVANAWTQSAKAGDRAGVVSFKSKQRR